MSEQPQPIDPPVAPGAAEYKQLLDKGAAPADVEGWKHDMSDQFRKAGFTQGEIDKHWGDNQAQPSPALVQHVSGQITTARVGSADVALPSADMRGHMVDHYQSGDAHDQGSWYESVGRALSRVGEAGYDASMTAPKFDVGQIGAAGRDAMKEQMGLDADGNFTKETMPPFAEFAHTPFGEKLLGTPDGRSWYQSIANALGGAAVDVPALTYRALGAYIAGGTAELGMFLKQAGATDDSVASVMETARNAPQALMDTMAAIGPAFEMPTPKPAPRNITPASIAEQYRTGVPDAQSFAAAARTVKENATPAQLREIEAAHVEAFKETGINPWVLSEKAVEERAVRDEVLMRDPQGELVTDNIKQVSPPEPSSTEGKLLSLAEDREAAERGDKAAGAPVSSFSAIHQAELQHTDVLKVFRTLEGSGDAAVSPKGAMGRYQIMPGTARQYGFTAEDMMDPAKNEAAARTILTDLARRFDGDIEAMAVAYNAGPGRAREWIKGGRDINSLPLETQHYVEHLRRLNGQPALIDYAKPSRGVDWQKYDNTAPEASRVNRRDPISGTVRPDPHAVASYMKNFAEEGNFGITVGDASRDHGEEQLNANFPHWNGNSRRVYIPDNPEELYDRWYGLSKYDTLYHEVGHAIHRADLEPTNAVARADWSDLERKPSGTEEAPGPSLKDEMTQTSQTFHPAGWERDTAHKSKRIETMADNIAMWISRPEYRDQMKQFGEKYGAALEKYSDMARRNLPTREGGTGENAGRWRAPERDGGGWLTAGGGTGEPPVWGGGRNPPPPAGGLPVPSPNGPRFIRNLDMAHEGFNDMVGKDPPGTKLEGFHQFVRQWVSELDPARMIDKFLAKHIDGYTGTHIEDAFRNIYGSSARAGEYLLNGVRDPITALRSSNSVGKAMDMAKKGGGTYEGFRNYLLALRTIDKERQGIKTGFNYEDALTIATGEAGKYAEAGKMWTRSMNDALDYGRKLGIFSDEQVGRMKDGNSLAYISMRRLVEGKDAFINRGSGASGFRARDPLRKMEGSDRQIRDPILASLDNFRMIVEMADRNKAAGNLVGAVENPLNTPLGLKQLKYDPKETISAHPGDPFKPYSLNDTAPEQTWQSTLAEQVRRDEMSKKESNVFTYIRDGQAEKWTSSFPGLADMVRGADTIGQVDHLTRAFTALAKVDRAGIVLPSGFPIKVWLKHQVTAWVLDPLSPPPFITAMRGAADAISKGEVWQDWIHYGGGGAAMSELSTKYIARDIAEKWDETGFFDRAINTVKHPIEAARVIHELLDTSSRLGYGKRAIAKGVDPAKAAMMSRKAYLDFSERQTGALANWLAKTVPFFRPHTLGLLQLGQSLSTPDGAMKALGKAVGGLTTPALIGAIASRLQDNVLPDDQKYANLPQEWRDTHFPLPSVGGVRIGLPVPYNIGFIFVGLPQRFVQHIWESNPDPDAFKAWAQPILDEWMPSVVPTALVPPIEWGMNHNLQSGRTLMPGNMGGVSSDAEGSADMKYVPGTTEISKFLSRVIGSDRGIGLKNLSPIAMDKLASEWGGSLGNTVLKTLNYPFSTNMEPMQLADTPIIGAFIARKPGMNATPIQEFFAEADRFSQAHADVMRSKRREQQGVAGADEELQQNQDVSEAEVKIGKINMRKEALYKMNSSIQGIYNEKSMTAAQKAQEVEDIYTQMLGLAKDGLENLRGLRQ